MTMRSAARLVLLATAPFALVGCYATQGVYVASELRPREVVADTAVFRADSVAASAARESHRVILIGDAGAPKTDGTDPVLGLLRQHALASDSNSTVIFLGDNVYPDGIPPVGDPGRALAEARLGAQLDAVSAIPGRVVFIPGNHEWNHSKPGGLQSVQREEDLVESALGERGTFLPSNGFPGPVRVDLADNVRLLVIDTEWWLGREARGTGEDEEAGYEVRDDSDFLLQLSDEVQRAGDRRLLVVGHHPIFSNGDHAGVLPPDRHLFPLRSLFEGAYVPLPILGSLSIFGTRLLGTSRQDLGHPRYRALRDAFTRIFSQHEDVIYASGHDHTLQYFATAVGATTQHQIVSGSGSNQGYAIGGRGALFAASRRGFFVLTYFTDGSARLDAIAESADRDRPYGDTLLSARILAPDPEAAAERVAATTPTRALPETTVAAPAERYDRSNFLVRALVGDGYRSTWATPVTVPVLDVGTFAGGLTPERLGGGQQTRSLRLAGADGRTYQLRSIDKAPTKALPLAFRFGLARDAAEDLTSAVYPYAAVIAAPLAAAAGVYHQTPRVVYVPDDARLGPYRDAFKEQVMLIEDRPDDDESDRPNYGRSRAVISPDKLYRDLDEDADRRVDAQSFLRARLLDLLIGDWDRHRDQWRWASFEPGELDADLKGEDSTRGKVYRPIARDRDWAFNDRDGLVFRLARPSQPKIQGFQKKYGNVDGLTTNGRDQDRRFLVSLERDDWERAARRLQAALTDSVLEASLAGLPPEVRARDTRRILPRLKARRDKLGAVALRYYRLQARIVDVVGTHEAEVFEFSRRGRDTLRLEVHKRREDGSKGRKLYGRTFYPDETTEVRVWARGGDDEFQVEEDGGRAGILLRFLGGAGEDVLNDQTDGRGVRAYDETSETSLRLQQAGRHARIERSDRFPEAAFGYRPAQYRAFTPVIASGYNADDGLILGGGVRVTTPGFTRGALAASHRIEAGVSTTTRGAFARYEGVWADVFGDLNAGIDIVARSPLSFRNFFGYQKRTLDRDADIAYSYYRVRLAEVRVEPYAERDLLGRIFLRGGPTFGYFRPARDTDRFIGVADVPLIDTKAQVFGGARAELGFDAVDDAVLPTRGLRFDAAMRMRQGVLNAEHSYVGFTTAIEVFTTYPNVPWATLALRTGGAHLLGTFPFYDAATLGGSANLRGYRADRFAGRSALYVNVEPRVRLFRFRAGYYPWGEAGVLGFYDAGRVWADDVRGAPWRAGYGGGAWLGLADRAALTGTYARSPEGGTTTFRLGFFF